LFLSSAVVFQIGLALVTFEQVRPLTIQLSDLLFFFSLLLLLINRKFRFLRTMRSGVPVGGVLILFGALLALLDASSINNATGPLARLFVLFGLFAPLAVIHSKNIRANLLFLLGGISANCAIALIQAWVFPEIVDMLSINPVRETDFGSSIGRFQGLSSHPNVLGLSAALAVLIGVGLFVYQKKGDVRWGIGLQVSVCALGGILSGSRTVLASLVPGLLVLALLQRRNRGAILRALAALVVIGVAVTYVGSEGISLYAERLDSSGQDYSPDYGRVMTAALALVEISQKPILGWGTDHFGEAGTMLIPETAEVGAAHNTFLQYWYGLGLLGGIGFLLLFLMPLRQMLRSLKDRPSTDSADAVRLGLACYVLLFVVLNVQPILYNRFVYIPMFVIAGFAVHALDPVKAREAARGPLGHLPAASVQATS
jgi:O-antigen ligase